MPTFSLYSPEVVVNNEPINIVPATFSYKDGFGEDTVSSVANGTNVENIISTDLTTKKGMIKFSVASTASNAVLLRILKNQPGGIVIKVSDAKSDFTRTLTSGPLISDPEVQLQNEGVIELEFEGNSLV